MKALVDVDAQENYGRHSTRIYFTWVTSDGNRIGTSVEVASEHRPVAFEQPNVPNVEGRDFLKDTDVMWIDYHMNIREWA